MKKVTSRSNDHYKNTYSTKQNLEIGQSLIPAQNENHKKSQKGWILKLNSSESRDFVII